MVYNVRITYEKSGVDNHIRNNYITYAQNKDIAELKVMKIAKKRIHQGQHSFIMSGVNITKYVPN